MDYCTPRIEAFQKLCRTSVRINLPPGISLYLSPPRRDPTTGTIVWPGPPISGTRVVFWFDQITPDQDYILLRSLTVLSDRSGFQSVEKLKDTSVLPEERLQAASPWVSFGKTYLTGLSMKVPARLDWDRERKTWTWVVAWKTLASQYYQAKQNKILEPHFKQSKRKQRVRHGDWP